MWSSAGRKRQLDLEEHIGNAETHNLMQVLVSCLHHTWFKNWFIVQRENVAEYPNYIYQHYQLLMICNTFWEQLLMYPPTARRSYFQLSGSSLDKHHSDKPTRQQNKTENWDEWAVCFCSLFSEICLQEKDVWNLGMCLWLGSSTKSCAVVVKTNMCQLCHAKTILRTSLPQVVLPAPYKSASQFLGWGRFLFRASCGPPSFLPGACWKIWCDPELPELDGMELRGSMSCVSPKCWLRWSPGIDLLWFLIWYLKIFVTTLEAAIVGVVLSSGRCSVPSSDIEGMVDQILPRRRVFGSPASVRNVHHVHTFVSTSYVHKAKKACHFSGQAPRVSIRIPLKYAGIFKAAIWYDTTMLRLWCD